jgi:hypothetical protein
VLVAVSGFGVNVTFILNILQRDMSILATDRKAIAEWPVTATPDMTVHAGGSSIVHDYKKNHPEFEQKSSSYRYSPEFVYATSRVRVRSS